MVHDELVYEIPTIETGSHGCEDPLDFLAFKVPNMMGDAWKLKVPIKVDSTTADRWAK